MNYEVRRLKLFEPLNFSIKENSSQDFSKENDEELVCFINKIPANSINPNKKDFLTQKKYLGTKANENDLQVNQILPGNYFFVQYFLSEKDFSDKTKIDYLLEDLAEAIFLEALWQEVSFADETIYVRKLKEGNCSVFQLFVKVNQNF